MKALEIQRFGEPADVIRMVEILPPPLRSGNVRVWLQAAGVDKSDAANARGSFPAATLPCVPGREFAGEVVEGPSRFIGLPVWGSGGELGFMRNGSHAEMIDIPIAAICERPGNLSAEQAAGAARSVLTAYAALAAVRYRNGEVAIVARADAVGAIAAGLVEARGGQAIAVAEDGAGAAVAVMGGSACAMPGIMASLAPGGRIAVYAVEHDAPMAPVDLGLLHSKRLEVIGATMSTLSVTRCAAILKEVRPLIEKGVLDLPAVRERYRLEEFARAYGRSAVCDAGVVFSFS